MAHSSLKASQVQGLDAAMNCDICIEEKLVEAEAYCTVCNQYLCQTCRSVHQRMNVSKSHKLFMGDDLAKANVSYRRNLEHSSAPEEKIKCLEHRREDVEYFCERHDAPCCEKCKRNEHRNCAIEPLYNVARKQTVRAANQATLKHVKNMHAEIETILKSNESEFETFTGEKNDVVNAIKSQRKKIDEVVDQWEQKLLDVVDNSFEEKAKQIHDHKNVFSDIKTATKEKSTKLDTAMKSLDEEAVVVASAARMDMKKYKAMLSEIQEEKVDVKIEINTAEPSRKLSECLESISQLFVTKQRNGQRPEHVYPDDSMTGNRLYRDRMAVEYGDIFVERPGDKEVPYITGIEVLQDGRIVMCDAFNLKLKLYDSSFKFLVEKELSSRPSRMSLTSVFGEVVVALRDEDCLQLATVDSEGTIKVGDKVQLNITNNSFVNQIGDKFLIQHVGPDFQIVDRNGQRITSVPVKNLPASFNSGRLIYICTDVNQTNVYVVNEFGGCIGFAIDSGEVFFHFKDSRTDCEYGYSGVTTDPDGNVYVGGLETGDIVQVSPSGKKIGVPVEGIKGCMFIKFISSLNILFVKQKGANVVKMYRLL